MNYSVGTNSLPIFCFVDGQHQIADKAYQSEAIADNRYLVPDQTVNGTDGLSIFPE